MGRKFAQSGHPDVEWCVGHTQSLHYALFVGLHKRRCLNWIFIPYMCFKLIGYYWPGTRSAKLEYETSIPKIINPLRSSLLKFACIKDGIDWVNVFQYNLLYYCRVSCSSFQYVCMLCCVACCMYFNVTLPCLYTWLLKWVGFWLVFFHTFFISTKSVWKQK
jgi:hypothetical protein